MPPREQDKVVIERATTPRGELQLQRRLIPGQEKHVYEIIFNGVFLMASYNERSEKALAALAIEPLASVRKGLRVLIGGLGMGHTLRAALDFEEVQVVEIAEIEEYIIRWARGIFSGLNGRACADPRVGLMEMDFGDYVFGTDKDYDAIILDVDNGPAWLALEGNRRLYERQTLIRIRELLSGGGVFTVWAAERSEAFERKLEEIFEQAETITVEDYDIRGQHTEYYIYRAQRFMAL
ncbi:MAG: spermine/spermidine synthase [Deltaproteobacteria bacterium]|nr:MAG: spermine/spermidine synthase [Deltaproteobacteria bacterium]